MKKIIVFTHFILGLNILITNSYCTNKLDYFINTNHQLLPHNNLNHSAQLVYRKPKIEDNFCNDCNKPKLYKSNIIHKGINLLKTSTQSIFEDADNTNENKYKYNIMKPQNNYIFDKYNCEDIKIHSDHNNIVNMGNNTQTEDDDIFNRRFYNVREPEESNNFKPYYEDYNKDYNNAISDSDTIPTVYVLNNERIQTRFQPLSVVNDQEQQQFADVNRQSFTNQMQDNFTLNGLENNTNVADSSSEPKDSKYNNKNIGSNDNWNCAHENGVITNIGKIEICSIF